MGSMNRQKDFTVAIVGGGIGGLHLALGLLQRNVPVQIYEAAPEFKEVGLGLTISPAAHRAMLLIDPRIRQIHDSLITTHADSPGFEEFLQTWFELIWASGEKEGDIIMDIKAQPSGQKTVHRASFLDALVDLVPKDISHFGKRLVHLVENETGVNLTFADGTSAQADVVIGCDGIRSKVKEFVVPQEYEKAQPHYSGMYGYRAVLDMETMVKAVGDRRARVSTLRLGKGAYAISYPIMRAQKVNVGLFMTKDEWDSEAWVRPASRADMLNDFGNMGEGVNSIMEHMSDTTQWAIFEPSHISTYARSRVAILGDAAHATTPHIGAGAGQAIEDAHVLSELLNDPRVTKLEHIVAALEAYDAIRRPRSQKVVDNSRANGHMLCLDADGVGDDPEKLREAFESRIRWVWDCDVEDQAERARRRISETIEKSEGRGGKLYIDT